MRRLQRAGAGIGVAVALLAGCGSSESPAAEPAATEPAATESVPDEGTAVSTEAATSTVADAPDTTPAATTPAESTVPDTTVPGAAAAGTAVVQVGDERYEFRVIQCLRDQPSAFGDQIIDMTLDGVPPDTPDDLIEPLLGVIGSGTDVMEFIEPALEYGPALSVSRFDDGGDYLVLYDFDEIEIGSDPDPLALDGRFLEVPDGDSAITITGATTSSGAPLQVTATCP